MNQSEDYISRCKLDEDLTLFLQLLSSQCSYRDTKEAIAERVEGTCVWFLSQKAYKEWTRQSGGVLLVSADPGCGKSVLAKYLVDGHLPKVSKDSVICYYFFKDGLQDKLAPAPCALLHQLYSADRKLLENAWPTISEMGESITRSVTDLFDLIWDAGCDPDAKKIVIVLDALDECYVNDCHRLFRFLRRIRRSAWPPDKLKFLITSRPYDNILSNYGMDVASNRLHVPGEDESKAISQEVDLVIKHRSNMLLQRKKIDQKLRLELANRLLGQENRTYLWVHLLFEELENSVKKTSREVDKLSQNLPRNVHEAYERILERSQNEDNRQSVFQIFCALLVATRPLKVQEIQCIAKIRSSPRTKSDDELDLEETEDFVVKMRNWCGLFVQVYQGNVSFIHQTAREFLLVAIAQPERLKTLHSKWRGSISLGEAHAIMVRLCEVYISLCCQSLQSRQDFELLSWAEKLKIQNSFPWYKYAAYHWDYHLDEGRPFLDDDFLNLAGLLCSPESGMPQIWFRYRIEYCPDSTIAVAASLPSRSLVESLLAKCEHKLDAPTLIEALQFACFQRSDHNARLVLDSASERIDILCQRTLEIAICHNSLDIADGILKKHSNIEPIDPTPLDRRNAVLMDLLFRYPDSDLEGEAGLSAIKLSKDQKSIGTRYWQDPKMELMKILLRIPVDLETLGEMHMTVLLLAASCGWVSAVGSLARNGVNVNHQDYDGRTAMHHALIDKTKITVGESEAIIETLLIHGANPNILSDSQVSVLMLAVRLGSVEIVRLLLEHQADPNIQDEEGFAPLHLATDPDIARALLEHGADPKLRNINGTAAETVGRWQDLKYTVAYRRPSTIKIGPSTSRKAKSGERKRTSLH